MIGIITETNYVYLKNHDSPRVIAMNYSLYEYLKQGSINFRKRGLMNIASDKVEKITISMAGSGISAYEQTSPRQWKMTLPEKPMDNPDNLNNLMTEFCYLTADEFVADLNFSPDLVTYELDKPRATILLEWQVRPVPLPHGMVATKDSLSEGKEDNKEVQTKTLLIGRKADEHYYARFADDVIIFKITPGIFNTITKIVE
ncbi:MAG: DUF4340 domain-containing protein [Planctomycetota bacterium]|nr:DUF4340 domain-containing protein [Planctomycetota bacterium]MDI6786916.1 DUF4340 domain-containing protein [Planctomycetota bacterium]